MNSLPRIRSVTPYLYRIPLETPVVTSFGTMRARSALFIAIDDTEGHRGWGEVWCNFPDSGALHRYRLLHEVFVPLMVNQPTAHPVRLMADVKMKTRILRLQTAEYGPLDQCAAGLDCALWDLYARQHGQPLYQVLGGTGSRMPVYASGINPSGVQETIALAQQAGHTAFKVKVGFGEDVDRHTLQVAREVVGYHFLAADANQAWSIDTALHMGDMLDAFELQWLEEPIAADSADSDWQRLCQALRTPLAAGENMNRLSDFERATCTWGLQYMQPDLAKWGGISECMQVVEMCKKQGITYCPHYLGGGIGLMASAHLLAASNQSGWLEMDVNPNPLRSEVLGEHLQVHDGHVTLSSAPGLGFDPDLQALQGYAQFPTQ